MRYLVFIISVLLIFGSSALAETGTKSSPPKELVSKEVEALKLQVEKDPNNPDLHFELAMAYSRSSSIEKGWPELQKVDDLDPGYADKLIKKSMAKLKANPKDTEVRYRLAFGYYFKGLKDKDDKFKKMARDEFDSIVKIDPKHVWAMNYLGYLYAEENNLDKAIELWKQSLAIDPNNPVTHFVLGHGYYRKGEVKKALMEIGKAFELRSKGY